MATAATENELEIKAAATGDESLLENIHETAVEEEGQTENENKGLEQLTPKGTTVWARGEKFQITGFEIDDILEVSNDLANFGLNFAAVDRNDLPVILAIVCSNLPTVVKVLARALKKDEAWTRKIALNDLPEIIKAVYEENAPFFRQIAALLPETQPNPTTTEETPSKSETEESQAKEPPLTGSD